ncbi:neuronal acetylcholine receptor subunit alpha-7-like [Pecten maximus]|uniref:neuronal acetylcholine receptor subunit alpha-7-like n=1 Tax=Pecten maximus TaxID=6579 RepID=UPI0014586D57|nr:neuronal acetylcholine receptor subunit alpha-7-like [Pecten maximus]
MLHLRATLLVVFTFFTHQQSVLGGTGTMDDWIRLTNTLFSNYTREIYPVYNYSSDTLPVDASMFLLSILDFDEVSGVITISAGMTLLWNDYRLRWSTSDYGGIEHIQVNASKVWKPKAYVITAADDLSKFGSDEFDVTLSSNGLCAFSPGKLLKSTCSVDMSKFPADTQICSIRVLLWTSFPEVVLTYTSTVLDTTYYTPNGEWNIDGTSVSYYMGFGSPSTTLDFTLHISRKYLYFIVSLTIPILLLCFLLPFAFLLPAPSGERISYTITMFLSLAVYMTLISDNLPKVSENMAGMSYFLLFSLFYSSVLIVLTIFTLRCDAMVDVREFPRWLRRFTCYWYKLKTNKITSNERSLKIPELREKEVPEVENNIDVELDFVDVSHRDVIRIIDISLFGISFLVIVTVTLWFLCSHYT